MEEITTLDGLASDNTITQPQKERLIELRNELEEVLISEERCWG